MSNVQHGRGGDKKKESAAEHKTTNLEFSLGRGFGGVTAANFCICKAVPCTDALL